MMDLQRELEARIKAHPMIAVAIAFGAGALVALGNGRDAAPKRTVRSTLIGGLGAIAVGLIRTMVLDRLSEATKGWLDPESAASRDPAVESFLEH